MASQKKILKMFVIIILVVFLLSTALMSVMYLTNRGTEEAEITTGDIVAEVEDTTIAIDENLVLTWDEEVAE